MPPASVLRPGNIVLSSCPASTSSPPYCGLASCAAAGTDSAAPRAIDAASRLLHRAFIMLSSLVPLRRILRAPLAAAGFGSIHARLVEHVDHLLRLAGDVVAEILDEDVDDLAVLARRGAGRVRGYQHVRHRPERRSRRKRFDRG